MAYRSQALDEATSTILIVLEGATGRLQFLVDPNWRAVVQAEDVEYMESLLNDFLERAQKEPETLFKQISALNVGPIVTQATGEQISDHPSLLELSTRFVRL